MRCPQRTVSLQRPPYVISSLLPACTHPAALALKNRRSFALFAADDQLEQDLEAELDALDDIVMNRPANKGRDQVGDHVIANHTIMSSVTQTDMQTISTTS
jgi:hypothetical protein